MFKEKEENQNADIFLFSYAFAILDNSFSGKARRAWGLCVPSDVTGLTT